MYGLTLAFALALPPLDAELERFPDHAQASAAVEFGLAFRRYCVSEQALSPHRWLDWQEVIEDTDCRLEPWHALNAATDTSYARYYRQERLQDLKTLLTPAEWSSGILRPPVPIHRFVEIP